MSDAVRRIAVALLVVSLLAAGLSVPAGAQETPPEPPHRIYGTVSDDGGAGVTAVEVVVRHDGERLASALTDDAGYFDVTVADPAPDARSESLTVTVQNRTRTVDFEPGRFSEVSFAGLKTEAVAAETVTLEGNASTNVSVEADGVESVGVDFAAEKTTSVGVQVVEESNETDSLAEEDQTVVATVDVSTPDEITAETAVTLTVDRSRLDARNISPSEVRVAHYDGTEWETLNTTVEAVTPETVTVEGLTESFSLFAVVGPSGGGSGGGSDGGTDFPARTIATVDAVEEVTDGTTATVTVDNYEIGEPVSVPLRDVETADLAVERVRAGFDMGTNIDNELTVRASAEPPTDVPAVEPGAVQGYVTVEIRGNLADRATAGSFVVNLENTSGDLDPDAVTIHRYGDGGWQAVETRHVNGTRVRGVADGFSTFAVTVVGGPEDEAATTTTTTTTVSTTRTPSTTTATTETRTREVTRTSTQAETQTPVETTGASGPGFGVPAVLAALLALVVLRKRR